RGIDFGRVAIGQECHLSVTPLQMAEVAATIANGGVRMKPRLVERIVAKDGRVKKSFRPERAATVMSPQSAAQVGQMMQHVVEEGTGTAARLQGISVAGKTGTAEIPGTGENLGRDVALKMLHRRFAQDQEFVERFRREASAAAGLSHPNVVGVYDRGEYDGTYYIAMEYLRGRTLKDVIGQEAPLDQERAV